MEIPDIYQTLQELLPFLYGMWILFFILTGWILFKAKTIDPLPFLPLVVLVSTVNLGLRISAIWFVMTFQISDPVSFPAYWAQITDPSVLRPLLMVFGGLSVHSGIYAFSELKLSKHRKTLTFSTRVLFHTVMIMVIISVWVHIKIFDQTILIQRRNYNRLPGTIEFDGYGLETPKGSLPVHGRPPAQGRKVQIRKAPWGRRIPAPRNARGVPNV